MKEKNLALQTWTVLDALHTHREQTLSNIRELGIKYLELAGNAGMSPIDFAKLCRRQEFDIIGVHQPPLTSAGVDDLVAETIAHCKAYNCSFATVMLDAAYAEAEGEIRQKEYLKYASIASQAGKKLSEHQITLCYHCYPYDLEPIEGSAGVKSGLDILLENADPENLMFELDVHFIHRAKVSSEGIFQKCGRRCRIVHVNDVTECGQDGRSAVLGEGQVDWGQVLEYVRKYCAVEWFVLEHTCSDPIEWIKRSREYWRTNISPQDNTGGIVQ